MKGKQSSADTRTRIIAAAIEVAAKQGYSGATTRAISEAAGVNEVTLFRLFGSKEKLFAESVEQFGGPAMAPAIALHFSGDYRRDLTSAGRMFYGLLLERKELLKLALCESANIPEVAAQLARNPREFRRMLAQYLQTQMSKGVVRQQDPETMAQAFLGMFFAYVISKQVFGEEIEPSVSDEKLVARFVDIFINGTIQQHSVGEVSDG